MDAATDLQVNARRSEGNPAGNAHLRLNDEMVSRLVRRAAEGEQRAWNELVEQFSGLVWGTARAHRLSDADAAEVSQTTWLRLIENIDRLHDPARVGAWLATTARRESIQQLHRTSRVIVGADELPSQVSDEPAPGAALLTDERDIALWSALARLPVRDRRLLRMLMADPRPSYTEISAALGMPIGSIGPTRARALDRLRSEAQRSGLSPCER